MSSLYNIIIASLCINVSFYVLEFILHPLSETLSDKSEALSAWQPRGNKNVLRQRKEMKGSQVKILVRMPGESSFPTERSAIAIARCWVCSMFTHFYMNTQGHVSVFWACSGIFFGYSGRIWKIAFIQNCKLNLSIWYKETPVIMGKSFVFTS